MWESFIPGFFMTSNIQTTTLFHTDRVGWWLGKLLFHNMQQCFKYWVFFKWKHVSHLYCVLIGQHESCQFGILTNEGTVFWHFDQWGHSIFTSIYGYIQDRKFENVLHFFYILPYTADPMQPLWNKIVVCIFEVTKKPRMKDSHSYVLFISYTLIL